MSQDKIDGSDILIEFLEVAFNQILFFRNLYPKEIFHRKRMYSMTVYVCEHPELNEYVRNVLTTVRELLKENENSIKTVNLVFYDKEGEVIEKFVFDLLKLEKKDVENDPYYLKTEEALRTICLKLSTCGTYLKPLPENSSFGVEIVTYESAHVKLSENICLEDFPWILVEKNIETSEKRLLPLKNIKTNCVNIEMYVLEIK